MAPLDELVLPVIELHEVSIVSSLMNYPPIKALLPLPILLAIAPALWWFFRDTWQTLERERRASAAAAISAARPLPSAWLKWSRQRFWKDRSPPGRHALVMRGKARPGATERAEVDYRPVVCLLMVAIVLTLHEYFGGRSFYESTLRPQLVELSKSNAWLRFEQFDELYGYGWWVGARVTGYLAPLVVWKLLFPRDSLLDMGLRTRGFLQHLWIYIVCLVVVVVAMLALATQPEFLNYYPFYKKSSRSWFDFLAWQAMYWLQFFALELFFRGWMLAALRRTMGMGAIFVMVVPYCMIHYGKPYLEAHAAIVAGVVLGSLAMRTRSIYAGFLVHISVAALMDTMALASRDALPTRFWPELGQPP